MKRTQIWCDQCGAFIQDKRTGQGADHPATIENSDTSWELWSPNDHDDQVLCSLECVVLRAQALIYKRIDNENS